MNSWIIIFLSFCMSKAYFFMFTWMIKLLDVGVLGYSILRPCSFWWCEWEFSCEFDFHSFVGHLFKKILQEIKDCIFFSLNPWDSKFCNSFQFPVIELNFKNGFSFALWIWRVVSFFTAKNGLWYLHCFLLFILF